MPMSSMTEGVDDSLYSEGESAPKQDKGKPESVDDQNEDNATDLMAKSSFPGGCKPGDRYEVEITGDHGDQFSVKVVESEKGETRTKLETDAGADPELAEVNSKY